MSWQALKQCVMVWDNPLFMKELRGRLRQRKAAAWAVITFVITLFVFLSVFSSAQVRGGLSSEYAGKAAFVPLLVIQGIILMLMGTRSVAVSISQDRVSGLVDLHRMTPMRTTPKLFGALFGMPVREYMMFALTLPFTLISAVLGGISLVTVAHVYLVFFSSVLLYHMTGFTVGMLVQKARRAGNFAQISVIGLYVFMPQLARLGFTFLGFLTILPAYYGILARELVLVRTLTQRQKALAVLDQWREVQFFDFLLHPTVYTLLIQGLLFLCFFTILVRKWERQDNHAFSKRSALVSFVVLQVLLVGSVWPFFTKLNVTGAARHKWLYMLAQADPAGYFGLLSFIFFMISGGAVFVLLLSTTPRWNTYVQGLRRVHKLKLARIPLLSDASSSFLVASAFCVCAAVGYYVLWHLTGHLRGMASPVWWTVAIPPLLFAACVMCLQAAREYWETRGFLMFLFFFWVCPLLIAQLLLGISNALTEASYLSIGFPPVAFFYAIQNLLLSVSSKSAIKTDLAQHIPTLTILGVLLPSCIAIVLNLRLASKRAKLRKQEESRAISHTELPSVPALPSS